MIPPQGSQEFVVQLDTARAGHKFGEIRFSTNDLDTPVFQFNIEGEVTGALPAGSPLIDLPGPAVGYAFQQEPVIIDRNATVSGAADFRGGSLVVEMAGGLTPDDRLGVVSSGNAQNGIVVSGTAITYSGTPIGSLAGGAGESPLVIDFNDSVMLGAVSELLQSVTYANVSPTPGTRPRYVRFTLTEAGGSVSNQPVKKVVLADFERNVAPQVAAPISDRIATEDAAFDLTLPPGTFSDGNTFDATLVWAASTANGSALPGWLSFDPQLRRLTGTPRNDDVGALDVRITATDLGGLETADVFEIDIQNTNDPPVVANGIPDQQAFEDVAFEFTFPADTFADIDAGDSLSYNATLPDGSALPSWMMFEASQRRVSGTPANADVGTVTVRVTATDEAGAAVGTEFDVAVLNVNGAPVVSSPIPDQTATQDQAFDFIFAGDTFTDSDIGDRLNYSAALASGLPLPAWLVFDGPTRRFHGTPANQHVGTTEIAVVAADNANLTAHDEFTLVVENVNDPPLAIELSHAAIDEGVLGAVVGDIYVDDPDAGDSHRLTVSDDRFGIVSGQLKLRDDVRLDHEASPSVELGITATDAGLLTHVASFMITVNDVNEFAPSIEAPELVVIENAETGSLVGTIAAADADTSQTVRFELGGSSALSIDPDTGDLRVADSSQLDYESAEQLSVSVSVTDNGVPPHSTLLAVTVAVEDANEFDPVLDDTLFHIDENTPAGTLVGTLSASDQDHRQQLSYQIADTSLPGAFEIVADTGELVVSDASLLDHETHTDVSLTVVVNDSGSPSRSTTGVVTVEFRDVNEFKPRIDAQTLLVDENSPPGTLVGVIQASDDDRSQQLRYRLVAGNTNNVFALEPDTGEITINASLLDHELTAEHHLFIEVTDNVAPTRSAVGEVTISVRDVNEFAPSVPDQGLAIDEGSENGKVVGQVFASDADTSQTLSFAIVSGNDGGAFAIDQATGELAIAASSQLDHESIAQHRLTVQVTDSGTPSRLGTGTVFVSVLDVNEPPEVRADFVDQVIGANVVFAFDLPENSFVDPDAGDSLLYAAELTNGGLLPNWLSFDLVSLQFSGAASAADTGTLEVRIIAEDHGEPPLAEMQSFELTITDNPFPWNYMAEPRDVNRDDSISPVDALIVINELNSPNVSMANQRLPLPYDPALPQLDVNADGFATAVDALIVINHLNQPTSLPVEAEAVLMSDSSGEVRSLTNSPHRSTMLAAIQLSGRDPRGSAALQCSRTTTSTTRRINANALDERLLEMLAIDLITASTELLAAYGDGFLTAHSPISARRFSITASTNNSARAHSSRLGDCPSKVKASSHRPKPVVTEAGSNRLDRLSHARALLGPRGCSVVSR
jgi:hypothetical protein